MINNWTLKAFALLDHSLGKIPLEHNDLERRDPENNSTKFMEYIPYWG